jgi:hypothetical protein
VPFTRVGFHALPSMRQLHCHVISADLLSEKVKNKKRWCAPCRDASMHHPISVPRRPKAQHAASPLHRRCAPLHRYCIAAASLLWGRCEPAALCCIAAASPLRAAAPWVS